MKEATAPVLKTNMHKKRKLISPLNEKELTKHWNYASAHKYTIAFVAEKMGITETQAYDKRRNMSRKGIILPPLRNRYPRHKVADAKFIDTWLKAKDNGFNIEWVAKQLKMTTSYCRNRKYYLGRDKNLKLPRLKQFRKKNEPPSPT